MAGEWSTAPLDALVSDILDRRGVTPIKLGSDFTLAGHRVISAKLMKGGRLDLSADEPRFVDAPTYRKWMQTPLLPDDVLLTSEAPLGELAYVIDEHAWCLGQRLFGIRTDKTKLIGRFLYYALKSDPVFNDLVSRATGTTVQGIRQSELRRVQIPVPPLTEQKSIAAILGSLDDKIELNRRMNATLEKMARALFQSWFVNFDPVRAKIEGRRPVGMNEATAALFPDSFEESPLGCIPHGWGAWRLDSFMELHYGKALKSADRIAGETPVYGSGGITGWHNESLVFEPSIIVGRKGTVGSLFWEDRAFYPIDTVFYVRSSKPLIYCYYLLRTLNLHDMNTDAAVPGLNRNNVYRLEVIKVPDNILKAFADFVDNFRQLISKNEQQSRTLAALRDTLLPKLLSGELRIDNLDKSLGKVI